MAIRVGLHHVTEYNYDRLVKVGPQVIRLRPAPHSRTPVPSYSLTIEPKNHFINWQQDPHGNYLARVVFPEATRHFRVAVDLSADLTVINPFDYFVEDYAEEFPFVYEPALAKDLAPHLECPKTGPKFDGYLGTIDAKKRRTTLFLVDLNTRLNRDIKYLIRMEPGVQAPEETLVKGLAYGCPSEAHGAGRPVCQRIPHSAQIRHPVPGRSLRPGERLYRPPRLVRSIYSRSGVGRS